MPAGCEFICKNEKCKYCNSGFNLTAPWPMGKICLIINAPAVKKNQKFRDSLIALKNEGRKFACITYPNDLEIKTEAFRVNFWSNEAKCIWQYDIPIEEGNLDLKTLINKSDVPSKCPSTGGELWDFETTIKNGITCPHCKEELTQSRWFTNEE